MRAGYVKFLEPNGAKRSCGREEFYISRSSAMSLREPPASERRAERRACPRAFCKRSEHRALARAERFCRTFRHHPKSAAADLGEGIFLTLNYINVKNS